jgi:hypothetical protein
MEISKGSSYYEKEMKRSEEVEEWAKKRLKEIKGNYDELSLFIKL